MHARIAVGPSIFESAAEAPHVAQLLRHSLIRFLRRHGRFAFVDQDAQREFLESLRDLRSTSSGARREWLELYMSLRELNRIEVSTSTRETDDVTSDPRVALRAKLSGLADVAVIGSAESQSFSILSDLGYHADPRVLPDIALPSAVLATPVVTAITDRDAGGFMPYGSAREEFWETILRPVASGGKQAVVLDRFLLSTVERRLSRHQPVGAADAAHVTWLLRKLDSVLALGSKVELICARVSPKSGVDDLAIAEALMNSWNPSGEGAIGELSLTISKPEKPTDFPHDRHVRFSNGSAVVLPAGFDRLSDAKIWDKAGAKWNYSASPDFLAGLRRDEGRARQTAIGSTIRAFTRA